MADEEETKAFVESFLEHSSRYYDPQKAHDYYIRTRKLKGRHPAAFTDKKPNQFQDITLDRKPNPGIGRSNQQRTQAFANRQKQGLGSKKAGQVQKIAEEAKGELAKVTQELATWVASLKKKADADRAKIAKDASDKIKALPALPRGAGIALQQKRKENIAKIQNEAKAATNKVTKGVKQQTDAKRKQVGKQRNQIIDNVRTAIKQVSL